MTDKPILFSAPMVQALLEGRKTQTRRVLKLQPDKNLPIGGATFDQGLGWIWRNGFDGSICGGIKIRYAIGERFWVCESWRVHTEFDGVAPSKLPSMADVQYMADNPISPWLSKGRTSIFMPRWASRITLIVTDVRVQRLNDISEADAIAEGIEMKDDFYVSHGEWDGWQALTAKGAFSSLWDSINGTGAWEANPWVTAISFDVIKANIDATK